MPDTKVQQDVNQFIEYFKEVDAFVKSFEDAKLPARQILKDTPKVVRAMLLASFSYEGFFAIIAGGTSEQDVGRVRSIVEKLEPFAAKIIRQYRADMGKEKEEAEEKKALAEVTDIAVKPFYDYEAKRNKIRLMFFCDSDKLMDSTISFASCLNLGSTLLNELDGSLKAVAELDPKLLPGQEAIKAYKEPLERAIGSSRQIASRLKIELEEPKRNETAESATTK
jgi:hypothetical protein